jgi:nucleoside-diphosphate-sugar epimerase
MKIFVAGGTGAIGRQLLPRLAEAGHQVTAMTRSPERAGQIQAAGASPVVGDVFDRARLKQAMLAAEPEVLIHQLTSLPDRIDPRRIGQALAQTNRLRSEGSQILLEAAQAAGVRRVVAQSFAAYYAPGRPEPAGETEPLYNQGPASLVPVVQAITALEHTVLNTPGIEGLVLRYGNFYGPGTFFARDGSFAEDVARRRIPLLGSGAGIFSFIHVVDAAAATVLAVEQGEPGLYNIVDDEPAPVRTWLPYYAELLGAPRPLRAPKIIGRLAGGAVALFIMTEQRGVSNQKAKQLLGWQPGYASWRQGFQADLALP